MRTYLTKIMTVMLILTVISSSCKKDKNSISISGAFALYPMTVKWAQEYNKIHPEVQINISGGGAGKGMTDALSGMVDLGMFSREISDAEKQKNVWWVAVVKDAVVPTISASNPVAMDLLLRGLKKQQFQDIFILKKATTWGALLNTQNTEKINVYTRSDACGAAETWAKYLGKKQEDLNGIGVNGDPGMADALKNDKLGIGFNNVNYAFDSRTKKKYPGMEVIPIDINENGIIDPQENFYNNIDELTKAIADGIYPSPPARDLYFVAKESPDRKAIKEFLKWILTDGQKFVSEAGYVKLTDEKIKSELEKLNK
jgi:phosphate transport system substrate-binding protein